jgi:hypothetical protein
VVVVAVAAVVVASAVVVAAAVVFTAVLELLSPNKMMLEVSRCKRNILQLNVR